MLKAVAVAPTLYAFMWICVSLTVIPEIIFPNGSFAGYVVNVTDPITFGCIATGSYPSTNHSVVQRWCTSDTRDRQWSEYTHDAEWTISGDGISTATGMIYQVERTLTFDTTANDTDTYTCEASNINVMQPTVAENFTLFVQGESEVYTHKIPSKCWLNKILGKHSPRENIIHGVYMHILILGGYMDSCNM